MSKVLNLSLKEVKRNPDQPRKDFHPELIGELADSIKANGLLQPITVRPHNGDYQIVAGERRYRAHKHAGLDTIKAIVVDLDDKKVQELAMIENLQRDDMKPSEVAGGYKAMKDTGYTVAEIAKALGKGEVEVRWYLALNDLDPVLSDAMDKDIITLQHAKQLARLEDKNEQVAMFRKVRGNQIKVHELAKYITKKLDGTPQMFATERTPVHQKAVEKFQAAAARIDEAVRGLDEETLDKVVEVEDFQFELNIDKLKALEASVRLARRRLQEAKAHKELE